MARPRNVKRWSRLLFIRLPKTGSTVRADAVRAILGQREIGGSEAARLLDHLPLVPQRIGFALVARLSGIAGVSVAVVVVADVSVSLAARRLSQTVLLSRPRT